ncbi:MAG: cobalamin-dependent protein [Desulfobulbaceae bacterium]|nr:cobalamin-dependent protein [Desulfobulbaceae bacterium]
MAVDCLLISANQVVIPYPVYPLGVAHLVGAMEKAGHRVTHFDMLAAGGIEALRQLLIRKQFDLVGVSIRNIDTVDSSAPHGCLAEIETTMQLIRDLSVAKVVLGGPGFSIMPEDLMTSFGADYGVVGAGEVLLPWLADRIGMGDPPTEKLFIGNPKEDAWVTPVFSEQATRYYLDHGGMLNVQTKRGCPYRCSYCPYPNIEGHTTRYRDPEEVVEEVERLTRDHGARFIFFTDSVFNDSKGHFRLVAETLLKRGNKTPWCAFFRPQGLELADFTLMRDAGMTAMEVGTDATCDKTLAAMGKGFVFEDVLRTDKLAREAKIPCAHFVMFGGPDEDRQTLTEGLVNLDKLESSMVFAFAGIRILPGTRLHKQAIAEGVVRSEQLLLEPTFYFSPKLQGIDLDKEIGAAFSSRMDRVYPCSEMTEHLAMLHKMGHVGPLWDALVRPLFK